jgi:hypothetical protein
MPRKVRAAVGLWTASHFGKRSLTLQGRPENLYIRQFSREKAKYFAFQEVTKIVRAGRKLSEITDIGSLKFSPVVSLPTRQDTHLFTMS